MPLSFQCEICRRTIRVADGSEGQKVYCPDCYTVLTVPNRREEPLHKTPEKPAHETPEDPLGIVDPPTPKPPPSSE